MTAGQASGLDRWGAKSASRRGITLVETLIAVTISLPIVTALMYLMVATAREQKVGFVQQLVFDSADRIQDKITRLLQDASRASGVYFADADGEFYNRIAFRQQVGPPTQELFFDSASGTLTYDPDVNVSNNEETIDVASSTLCELDNVAFRASIKVGGIPDSSIVLVRLRVSDHGRARSSWRDAGSQANWIVSTRMFAVNLRRE